MHPEQLAALNRQLHAGLHAELTRRRPDDAAPVRRRRLAPLAAGVARRARRATGWLLVDAGLRLAVDRDAGNAD